MDIKGIIEWLATDSATMLVTIFPYLLLGLFGLYLLWLVLGYLRVSQVGIEAYPGGGESPIALSPAPDGAVEAPRGIPYCPTDHLQFAPGTRFCPRCEGDLLLSCARCGATVSTADENCYRCGAPTNASALASS